MDQVLNLLKKRKASFNELTKQTGVAKKALKSYLQEQVVSGQLSFLCNRKEEKNRSCYVNGVSFAFY